LYVSLQDDFERGSGPHLDFVPVAESRDCSSNRPADASADYSAF
jgi:hypothetical protein